MAMTSTRLTTLLALWGAAILLGFWAVFALGGPLEDSGAKLAAAYAPGTPVTEQAAREAAAVIVRTEYPGFAGIEPAVDRREQYGISRWVIVYTDKTTSSGVRISITIEAGKVQVASFP